MNLGGIWTFILEIVGKVIIPVWNDLIDYLPVVLFLLVIVAIALLAWSWQRNAAANRPRVPARIPTGRKPADMHLPGPSLWPFVAPIGLVLMVFALAFGILDSLANMVLFGLGLAIGLIGVIGWYVDAKREYVRVASGGGDGHAAIGAGGVGAAVPTWTLEPPAGIHMPGPSAWPFLAPVGLLFAVAGLIFGPAMLIGGIVMGAIACIGWMRDASNELRDVEVHGHAEPTTRDPEKAFPRALGPLYVLVAGLAVLLTLTPWLLSLLPGGS